MSVPSESIKQQIEVLPQSPGVYKYYDANEQLLYIGKARNLKKRVATYFTGNNGENRRILLMTNKVHRIDYTVVNTEYDALLLENSLIKKYQPRYNVNLKDSKTYPYLVIRNERFPRVHPTRTRIDDGSEYYGPYASVSIMRIVLDTIRKLFPIRSCHYELSEKNIQAGKFRVCLDYHINLCKGPCEGLQSEADYTANIDHIRAILKGNTKEVIRKLKELMQEASQNFDFEKAEDFRQKIEALKQFQAKSTVVNANISNVDVFSIITKENHCYVNYMKVANGAIICTDTVEYKKKVEEDERDVLLLAVAELREKFQSYAPEVIVPFDVDFEQADIDFTVPKIGDKKKLLELSRKNAFYFYQDRQKQYSKQLPQSERNNQKVEKLRVDLGMSQSPGHIEGFDNSNIQGTNPTSAMVCFKNGKPSKADYRHFLIKTVEGPDDFSSMEEVVYRRYRRLLNEEEPLPQLVVIDGGKGQLNAAYKSLKQLGLENDIEVIGIAKKLEEIYKPGDPYPLAIDKKSESLKLIQQVRDEAHRFSQSHHRNKRIKSNLKSELEEVPGIGEKRKKALLNQYKSLKKIREATRDELAAIVGDKAANAVKQYFEKEVDNKA